MTDPAAEYRANAGDPEADHEASAGAHDHSDESGAGVPPAAADASDPGSAESDAPVDPDDPLASVMAERDDYLDSLRRLQADFENFRRRVAKDHEEASQRGAARLIDQLLPVLDSCDAALMHGASGVEPVFAALLGALEKEGLDRIDPLGQAFDPELHEAVLHEHGEDDSGPTVVEVLRPGYAWKGKIIRAAMVKVKG